MYMSLFPIVLRSSLGSTCQIVPLMQQLMSQGKLTFQDLRESATTFCATPMVEALVIESIMHVLLPSSSGRTVVYITCT